MQAAFALDSFEDPLAGLHMLTWHSSTVEVSVAVEPFGEFLVEIVLHI